MDINTIKDTIRDVPDFPQKGILFKDITPLLKDKDVFSYCIDLLLNLLCVSAVLIK